MTADWPAAGETIAFDRDGDDATRATEPTQPTGPPGPSGTPDADPGRRGLPTLLLMPIAAVAWWVVGFLPWIVGGLAYFPSGGPRTAIPMIAGSMSVLVVGGGLGGIVSGAVTLLGRGRWVLRLLAVVVGVAVAVAATLAQSLSTLHDPSPSNMSADDRVLAGLTAVVVAMTLVGLVWGLLVLAGPVGQGIALAGVAGVAPAWVADLVDASGTDGGDVYRWIGVALLAAGLVRIGLRPLVRLVWWPVAVVLAWLVGPTVTASSYLEQALRPGTSWSEIIDFHLPAWWDVWKAAASLDARPLTPWIAAIVAALIVAALVSTLVERRVPAERAEHPVP